MFSILSCILFLFLFIHFIPDCIEYDVWCTVIFIDSLKVVHMKIPFQVIPHQIMLVQILQSSSFSFEKPAWVLQLTGSVL